MFVDIGDNEKVLQTLFHNAKGRLTKVHKNRYFIDYPHYVNNVLAEYNLKVRIEHLEKECELRDGKQLKLFDDDDW